MTRISSFKAAGHEARIVVYRNRFELANSSDVKRLVYFEVNQEKNYGPFLTFEADTG